MSDRDHSLDSEFIEEFGLLLEDQGMPRIAGKIIALLALASEPLAFDQIQDRLQVSKSSVSTNTRRLESIGVVKRTALPGDRRTFFRLSDDPYAHLLEQRLNGMRAVADLVSRKERQLAEERDDVPEQLAYLRRFYAGTVEAMEDLVEQHSARGMDAVTSPDT